MVVTSSLTTPRAQVGTWFASHPAGAALLYLVMVGLICTAWFRHVWTDGIFGLFDWRKDEFFLAYLVGSLREQGMVPSAFFAVPIGLHYPTVDITRLYFANPEVISYSPFLGLAHLFEAEGFFLALLAIHLGLAAIGLWLLGVRWRFPFVYRVIAFVLLALNPWLMQHLAIGYSPWLNALLVPLTAWCLLAGRERPWLLTGGALLSALMIYQGGLHVWLWMNFTIALVTLCLALARRSLAMLAPVAVFGVLSVLAAAPRLLAITRVFHGFAREPLPSYSSWSDILGLLLDDVSDPYDLPAAYDIYGTNLYDGSVVVGPVWLVALAASILLLLRRAWRYRSDWQTPAAWLATAALFIVLGWDGVWRSLVRLLPLLSTDVYPWRFLFLAQVLLTIFVLHELVRLERTGGTLARVVTLCLCLALVPSNYLRNQQFCAVAAAGETRSDGFSLGTFLRRLLPAEERGGQRVQLPTLVHDHLVFPPSSSGYRLPWMTEHKLASFVVSGAALEFDAATGAALTAPSDRPLVISARPVISVAEAMAPLVAFGVVAIGWVRLGRRGGGWPSEGESA